MADTIAGLLTLRHANGAIAIAAVSQPQSGQGFNYADDFKVDELVVNGDIVSRAASQRKKTLTLDGVMSGASAAAFTDPSPLVQATVSGLSPTQINTIYNYDGLTITGREGANVTVQFKLSKPSGGVLTVN